MAPSTSSGEKPSANKKRQAYVESDPEDESDDTDTNRGAENKRKRIRLDYGKIITVTVTGRQTDAVLSTTQLFHVDENILFDSSPFIKQKISAGRSKTKYEIINTDPVDFKCYLDWIYVKAVSGAPVQDGGGSLLREQHSRLGRDDLPDGGVLSLCKLLRLAIVTVKDLEFKDEMLRLLGERALSVEPGTITISMEDGILLWGIRHDSHAKFISRRIPEWMASGLTREKIEKPGQFIDGALLKALRELLPHTKLIIRVEKKSPDQKATVDRNLAIKRSSFLSEVLKSGCRIPSGLASIQIALDGSRTVLLTGDLKHGDLDNWASTLVEEGHELRDLLSRYPNVETDDKQASRLRTALCNLWALAQALGDSKIQKITMDAIVSHSSTKASEIWLVSRDTAKMIAEKLTPDHGLRRWFVDRVASSIVVSGMERYREGLPQALLLELLIKTQEFSGLKEDHPFPSVADVDKYCHPI